MRLGGLLHEQAVPRLHLRGLGQIALVLDDALGQRVSLDRSGGQVEPVLPQRLRLAGQPGLEQLGGLVDVEVHHRREVSRTGRQVVEGGDDLPAAAARDGLGERREAHRQGVELGA